MQPRKKSLKITFKGAVEQKQVPRQLEPPFTSYTSEYLS